MFPRKKSFLQTLEILDDLTDAATAVLFELSLASHHVRLTERLMQWQQIILTDGVAIDVSRIVVHQHMLAV